MIRIQTLAVAACAGPALLLAHATLSRIAAAFAGIV